ncbi:MAG TPA: GldG family protein [Candidatus Limnocylindrales bacterium]|nr:GldG family protein [Candidatus Limnocylindrales bacterium]
MNLSHAWLRWVQLAAATVGLIWLLMAIVGETYVYNVRWDLSSGNRFTLSAHAKQVLAKVDKPIKIRGFIRTEDPRNTPLKDLLWQVSHENPHIEYDIVDVNRNPAMAAQYGVSSYGSTVVESDGKRADFSNPSEQLLMSAILKVLQEPKKVYALTGHGECSIENTDRHDGCSLVRDALSLESFIVEKLSLIGGAEIPADADVILIPGPQSDFLEAETRVLSGWLDRGGKLFVLIDPFRAPKLVALLGSYGIAVGANIVVDTENRMAGGEPWSTVLSDVNRQQLISSTLKAPPLFSLAAAVVAHDDEASGRSATTLLKTGVRSWASYDPGIIAGSEARFVAGRDVNGPIPVAVLVTEPATKATEPGVQTRLLVFGDSDFATNRFIDYLGNKDLLVNGVSWLAREDELIGSRPQQKTPGKNQLFISEGDLQNIFRFSVLWQPGLFLAAAIFVLLRRRYSE